MMVNSPDPESVPRGQRFRSTCPVVSTSRASVPASTLKGPRLCPEKRSRTPWLQPMETQLFAKTSYL